MSNFDGIDTSTQWGAEIWHEAYGRIQPSRFGESVANFLTVRSGQAEGQVWKLFKRQFLLLTQMAAKYSLDHCATVSVELISISCPNQLLDKIFRTPTARVRSEKRFFLHQRQEPFWAWLSGNQLPIGPGLWWKEGATQKQPIMDKIGCDGAGQKFGSIMKPCLSRI